MSKKVRRAANNLSRFDGVTMVKAADDLSDDKLGGIASHLGLLKAPPEMRQLELHVTGICPVRGIAVTGNRDGKTAQIWVSARLLQPASHDHATA